MRTVDFTGTVSQATMRPQDILPACMDVLCKYWPERFNQLVREIAYGGDHERFTLEQAQQEYSQLLANDDHSYWQSEELMWLMETVSDSMDEIAPHGCYFGAHVGDGSDYGYWPIDHLYDGGE